MKICRIFFYTLSAFSLFACDTIFEDKEQRETPDRVPDSFVPEQKPTPIADVIPREEENPTSSQPPPENLPIADEPVENDITLDYEVEFNENDNVKNFSSWLQTPEGSDQVSLAGKYKKSEHELNLNKNALLNFSSFALEQPLRIRTHGHKLILIGHSMNNLFIETQGQGQPSGDVIVFITSEELPTINTEGKEGKNGENAICPDPQHRCVELHDRTSRRTRARSIFNWQIETREARYAWLDRSLAPEIRERMNAFVSSRPRIELGNDVCGMGIGHIISISEPEIEGELLFKQTIRFPILSSHAEDDSQPNARLIEGQPGESGQDAGHVRIFQMSRQKRRIESIVRGGKAGIGGRNIKIPAAEKTEEIIVNSEVIEEQILLKDLRTKRTVLSSCASEPGRAFRPMQRVYSERFVPEFLNVTTNTRLDKHTLTIVSRSAGDDLDPQTSETMRAGAEGRSAFIKWVALESWTAWRRQLPAGITLPTEVLNQSPPVASGGRLSGDVLGLKTLPL